MKKTKYTNDMLISDAKRFTTRSEWSKKSQAAYLAASRRNLVDEACSHMTAMRKDWTNGTLSADAKRFSTRSEWKKKSPNAYATACNRKILDACCAHMTEVHTSWTDEMLFAEAKRFSTRIEWQKKSPAAYGAARHRKILDEACSHMTAMRKDWTADMLFADALSFSTRSEWFHKSSSAYQTAKDRGIFDACCSHMVDGTSASDNDAIYIWRAVGMRFNGEKVYKIGVTSARLGRRRIKQVTKASGIKCEMVVLQQVQGKATDLEKQLLVLGTDPEYTGFGGCTEFRALSLSALETAIALIERAQASEVLC